MRVTFEKLKDKCPTMEQFTDLLGKHMNKYNNTPSGGIDMDRKCPDQVYFENLAVKNEVHDKSILRILCGTFDERTVQKNGVQYQGRFYYHTDLIAHQGEKVIINYDPSNMDELNVFDIALKDALDLLNLNGRISVITFHSLEDKICKYTFNEVSKLKDVPKGLPVIPLEMQPKFKLVNRKPIIASDDELTHNHRAHSAKLRVIERVIL